MQPFTKHTGLVAAMDRHNVDTDQIIPKQFLKRIERSGFGQFLFFDWRFNDDGTPNPKFELNQPAVKGASVLLARRNFGAATPGPSPGLSATGSCRAILRYDTFSSTPGSLATLTHTCTCGAPR